jgi:hypothetical protein
MHVWVVQLPREGTRARLDVQPYDMRSVSCDCTETVEAVTASRANTIVPINSTNHASASSRRPAASARAAIHDSAFGHWLAANMEYLHVDTVVTFSAGLSGKPCMREGYGNMVHEPEPDVKYLYCWRGLRGLVRLAERKHPPQRAHLTLCGIAVGALTYAGREDVSTARPTCIACVRAR